MHIKEMELKGTNYSIQEKMIFSFWTCIITTVIHLTFDLDYPRDIHAKSAINMKIELNPMTEDEVYLNKLSTGLKRAFEKFTPEIIFFNAGSDILKGDPLGALSISPKGLIKRDELVFEYAKVFLLF
jgi:acetoin utilization deacetylase AcuC-like enzyme